MRLDIALVAVIKNDDQEQNKSELNITIMLPKVQYWRRNKPCSFPVVLPFRHSSTRSQVLCRPFLECDIFLATVTSKRKHVDVNRRPPP